MCVMGTGGKCGMLLRHERSLLMPFSVRHFVEDDKLCHHMTCELLWTHHRTGAFADRPALVSVACTTLALQCTGGQASLVALSSQTLLASGWTSSQRRLLSRDSSYLNGRGVPLRSPGAACCPSVNASGGVPLRSPCGAVPAFIGQPICRWSGRPGMRSSCGAGPSRSPTL
jgi:hypothetical protein